MPNVVATQIEEYLAKQTEPKTAVEIARAIDKTTTMTRTIIRDLCMSGRVCAIEKSGQRATYHRPDLKVAATALPAGDDPDSLLDAAKAEKVRDRSMRGSALRYMDVIHILKVQKHFTWKEIGDWFKARKVKVPVTNLSTQYKAWIKAGKPEAAQ